ncbi:hypothetical protein BHQ16_13135 [Mycobacterium shimoidei]|nr:hypothetical protein BHQ16_13135 [Mycobacterium shimoidei]
MVRELSLPIILAWLAITAVLSFAVPTLEQVAKAHSVSLSAKDAPSVKGLFAVEGVELAGASLPG